MEKAWTGQLLTPQIRGAGPQTHCLSADSSSFQDSGRPSPRNLPNTHQTSSFSSP